MTEAENSGAGVPAAGMGELDPALLEEARLVFAAKCEFFAGVAVLDRMPPPRGLEIAFAGRSNVGKSSLLNALTGHNKLARVSNSPGRTRQLNFFDLGEGRLTLVDMPGYGYAEASKAEINRWQGIIRMYLLGRTVLRRVMLLIDARHGIKENDADMMGGLDKAAVGYQVVLTKCDKISARELAERLENVTAALAKRPAAHPHIIATSSETGLNIPELRREIWQAVQG
ncbi:MAG: ribosome biogenesis GTP-binding protein YihA/YsxC [Alphaproteobacteria bacterium]|nr:ribosome biogenesis GTP-binding protein YihA/YsxC [Alphaproteobacteria bacterium]